MFPDDIDELARLVLTLAREAGLMLATVESCTGGLVAGALTAVPGSSDVVDRGFVTYSNAAKTALVGAPEALIAEHGAVSEAVVRAMAEGGREAAGVGCAVAVTGIAGPGGGTADKPVGLVWFAAARTGRPTLSQAMRFGDIGREAVRLASVRVALELLAEVLS
ncbi:MAG TPA: CinA family protein [Caulobacteraceae bacterium]